VFITDKFLADLQVEQNERAKLNRLNACSNRGKRQKTQESSEDTFTGFGFFDQSKVKEKD
jgi:hypothetical protein